MLESSANYEKIALIKVHKAEIEIRMKHNYVFEVHLAKFWKTLSHRSGFSFLDNLIP